MTHDPLNLKMGDLIRFKKDTAEFANFGDAQFTVIALAKDIREDSLIKKSVLIKVRHIKENDESKTFWANIESVESVVAGISVVLPNDLHDWVKEQANAAVEPMADIIIAIIRSEKARLMRKAKKKAEKTTFTRREYDAAVANAYEKGRDEPRTKDGW
jgi:hypothetical protein